MKPAITRLGWRRFAISNTIREMVLGLLALLAYIIIFLIGRNTLVSLCFAVIVFVVLHFLVPKFQRNITVIVKDQNEEEYKKYLFDLGIKISELERLSSDMPESGQKVLVQSIIENSKKIERKLQKDRNYKQAKDFVYYYLPMIVKMTDGYNEIIQNNVSNEAGIKFKENVENMLPLFENAVKNQLDAMFSGDTLDTSADMLVLKQVMDSNGLLNNSFDGGRSK